MKPNGSDSVRQNRQTRLERSGAGLFSIFTLFLQILSIISSIHYSLCQYCPEIQLSLWFYFRCITSFFLINRKRRRASVRRRVHDSAVGQSIHRYGGGDVGSLICPAWRRRWTIFYPRITSANWEGESGAVTDRRHYAQWVSQRGVADGMVGGEYISCWAVLGLSFGGKYKYEVKIYRSMGKYLKKTNEN